MGEGERMAVALPGQGQGQGQRQRYALLSSSVTLSLFLLLPSFPPSFLTACPQFPSGCSLLLLSICAAFSLPHVDLPLQLGNSQSPQSRSLPSPSFFSISLSISLFLPLYGPE
jgi:hypothetical protein